MRNRLLMHLSTIVLTRGELASFPFRKEACRISCVAGRLWITASGHSEDFMLGPGERVTVTVPGKIVVEALRTATVRLELDSPVRADTHTLMPAVGLSTRISVWALR